ncbi:hypothetical protein [Brevibacterium gallinarum]|uniref:Uncharacterized protein n=1 Tax=Brevibacterium gallinarum TaxID=2762220 RepID=A0ABR8WQX3_9MICO|nr:hypothetical protein [Brevibacterium gallinarum]MBD8019353.1 hypothetical protein [Brevibacterium gallinarum]
MDILDELMGDEPVRDRERYAMRRFWCLVMPVAVLGLVGYFLSFALTATLNGLGLVSAVVVLTALAVSAWDVSEGSR